MYGWLEIHRVCVCVIWVEHKYEKKKIHNFIENKKRIINISK